MSGNTRKGVFYIEAKRGDIYFVKNFFNPVGSEQAAGRPFLVVSPNAILVNSPGALCVPLTTRPKKSLPQHTDIDCLGRISTALCEQMRYIDESNFGHYYCTATNKEMARVDRCLLEAVGVPPFGEKRKMPKKKKVNH